MNKKYAFTAIVRLLLRTVFTGEFNVTNVQVVASDLKEETA
jgi:hypothetical protein